MRRNKKDQLRRAQEAELNRIVAALAANEHNYQQAEDALGIVNAIDFSGFSRVLDVGCGNGATTIDM